MQGRKKVAGRKYKSKEGKDRNEKEQNLEASLCNKVRAQIDRVGRKREGKGRNG
jgi:hypothetical protein